MLCHDQYADKEFPNILMEAFHTEYQSDLWHD